MGSEVETKDRDLDMFASIFLGSHGNEWNREKPRPLGSILAIKSFHRNAHVPAIRRYVSCIYLIDDFSLATMVSNSVYVAFLVKPNLTTT